MSRKCPQTMMNLKSFLVELADSNQVVPYRSGGSVNFFLTKGRLSSKIREKDPTGRILALCMGIVASERENAESGVQARIFVDFVEYFFENFDVLENKGDSLPNKILEDFRRFYEVNGTFASKSDTKTSLPNHPILIDEWLDPVTLHSSDKDDLISRKNFITDRLVLNALRLLRLRWVFGYQDPVNDSDIKYPPFLFRDTSPFCQIHHAPNHWFATFLKDETSPVLILDSMKSLVRYSTAFVRQGLLNLYMPRGQTHYEFVVKKVQQQHSELNNCALFSIAFLSACLQDKPVERAFFDENRMRKHLLRCIQRKNFLPFPCLKSAKFPDCSRDEKINFEVICKQQPGCFDSSSGFFACQKCARNLHSTCHGIPADYWREVYVCDHCSQAKLTEVVIF